MASKTCVIESPNSKTLDHDITLSLARICHKACTEFQKKKNQKLQILILKVRRNGNGIVIATVIIK